MNCVTIYGRSSACTVVNLLNMKHVCLSAARSCVDGGFYSRLNIVFCAEHESSCKHSFYDIEKESSFDVKDCNM